MVVCPWKNRISMTTMVTFMTIDQLEDFEYSSDVNKRLGIRYNYPPSINLNTLKGGGFFGNNGM